MFVQTSKRSARRLCAQLLAQCPKFFKALCEPARLDLLSGLVTAGRPCTVSELAARLPLDLSVVSRHLALMRDAGILGAEKRGRDVYYSVRIKSIAQTLRELADTLEHTFATAPAPAPAPATATATEETA